MKKMLAFILTTVMVLVSMGAVFVTAAPIDYFAGKDEISVVSIGGSITAGGNPTWSNTVVEKYFKTRYPDKTVNFHNAAIGGSGSEFGMFRLYRDVISYDPDFVFVEFAINDTGALNEGRSKDILQSMSNIMQQLAKLQKVPYVVMVYTTDMANDNLETMKVHDQVAKAFGLSTINLGTYIHSVYLKQPGATLSGIFGDAVHPNQTGYNLYGDFISKTLAENEEKYYKKPKVLSTMVAGREYVNPCILDYDSAIYSDKWEIDPIPAQFFKKSMITNVEGSKMTFFFTGKTISMIGTVWGLGGSASYVLDDKIRGIFSELYGGGKSCGAAFNIQNLPDAGWHKIVITVSKSLDPKKGFISAGAFLVEQMPIPTPKMTSINVDDSSTAIPITNGEVAVSEGAKKLSITFDTHMDPASFNSDNISIVKGKDNDQVFEFFYDPLNKNLIITLDKAIEASDVYTINLGSEISAQSVKMSDGDVIIKVGTSVALENASSVIEPGVVTFFGDSNKTITSIGDNKNIKAVVAFDTDKVSSVDAILMEAVYKDGVLSSMKYVSSGDMKANGSGRMEVTAALPDDKANCEVKAVLWDNLKNNDKKNNITIGSIK